MPVPKTGCARRGGAPADDYLPNASPPALGLGGGIGLSVTGFYEPGETGLISRGSSYSRLFTYGATG
jgi:hypothetical protein